MTHAGRVLMLFLEPLGKRLPLSAGVSALVGCNLGAARDLFCYQEGKPELRRNFSALGFSH